MENQKKSKDYLQEYNAKKYQTYSYQIKIISKNIDNTNSRQLKNKTNNNTPLKRNYNKFLNDNKQNKCLSPKDTSKLFRKISKQMKKQKINYNNIMSNLNDVNNIEFNENKFLINSERNKNYKIIFK